MTDAHHDRALGCLLGLACGDAVGTTVEFQPRGSFAPLTDLVGGGPFRLPAGYWTDDTSMALCLAESLLHARGFDARDQVTRYCNWWRRGTLSSTGECFDIGMTVQSALHRFLATGEPMAGDTAPHTAGNGSLMRLAPVVLYFHPDRAAVRHHAAESSKVTHAAPQAVQCCELFAMLLSAALDGAAKADLRTLDVSLADPQVAAIAAGAYLDKPREAIRGTGYCVASLEAALWCFHHHDTFEQVVLAAANLGDDADTTAAIAGQIAGAHYGLTAIPAGWLEKLYWRDEIARLATALAAR